MNVLIPQIEQCMVNLLTPDLIQQHEWELRTFLELVVSELRPKRTVELGTWKGAMGVFLSLVTDGPTLSLDIQDYRDDLTLYHPSNLTFAIMDGTKKETADWAVSKLGGPVDLLFVDDSHIYEDVVSEFNVWRTHMSSGGWMAFHDINPLANKGPDGKHSHLCQAHRFWAELHGNKQEIIATEEHKAFRGVIPHGGIGILRL